MREERNMRREAKMGPGTMRARSWVIVAILLLGLVSTLAVGCGDDTEDPIKVGAIVSATGPNSALGAQERNVLEMMETKISLPALVR